MFDLVAGFCHSQVLAALVELEVFEQLYAARATPEELARRCAVPPDRMAVLLRAGVALGLLRRHRGGTYGLARKGAALLGVPGLQAMIRHHRILYADMADPVAFFRGEGPGGLAQFWPYVFGAAQAEDPETAREYSDLMAQSQRLVAEETLRAVSLRDVRCLMDVGGGTGAFLSAAGDTAREMQLRLFDLPAVVAGAEARFARAGQQDRVEIIAGSFRDDPLPGGADMISLVRVLYDHGDATVAALLRKARGALPPGGRLLIAEPMSGGDRPERAGDAYFALYTMAMGTGRTRSADEISALCADAGFTGIKEHPAPRPFVTRVLTARVPG